MCRRRGKWADVYTVVTWDQRNCGKSYDVSQNETVLTKELFLTDGKELTEFILEYMSKDKITIMGHSWGSIFGANLVLEYPEYYDCFIGAGQLVDYQVPFYNINGDRDYQTNYKLAEAYFEQVNAPYKQMYIMENMTHGLLESDSEGFSEIIHKIAEKERLE